MPVLVASKFVEGLIKNELSLWGKKSVHKGENNSKVNNPIRPKSKLMQAFMPVLVTCKFDITCKFDKYLIKHDWEKLET